MLCCVICVLLSIHRSFEAKCLGGHVLIFPPPHKSLPITQVRFVAVRSYMSARGLTHGVGLYVDDLHADISTQQVQGIKPFVRREVVGTQPKLYVPREVWYKIKDLLKGVMFHPQINAKS